MNAFAPWAGPACLWGNLACARADGREGSCWRSVLDDDGSASSRRCRALADCVDRQLGAFCRGWRPGSIRPLAADAEDPSEPRSPYVADVLRADASMVASFACPLEAVRFAALLYEPGSAPRLRRRWDGATKTFSPSAATRVILQWLTPAGPRE